MVLVFDIVAAPSFAGLAPWLARLIGEVGVKCLIFVYADKTGLPPATVREWAGAPSVAAHFTFALSGAGVAGLFRAVARPPERGEPVPSAQRRCSTTRKGRSAAE
jgi:hypothetical protein